MKKLALDMKKIAVLLIVTALIITSVFVLSACGDDNNENNNNNNTNSNLYNIDFNGNIAGEKYDVEATTWQESDEEGFESVYTLVGEVPYNKAVADQMGYTDGRENFALIRFTSDVVNKVNYDEATQEGFYAEITNFYGTDHQAEPSIKHGGFSSGNATTSQTTYFLYQGVDDTVRTMTVKISFDGTEENARLYKFVIDPANYTLESAPALQVVNSPVSISDIEFENAVDFSITEIEPNRYIANGNVATMTAEQAEAFWAGVAKAGDKYVILHLTFDANSTIKYGFVDNLDTDLSVTAKVFEANGMTSEDFILRVNPDSSNMIWKVEVSNGANTTTYTVDMSNLTYSL